MACLRELNNNKSYSAQASSIGLSKKDTDDKITPKLIVEFSLENMQKVKVLKEREERQAQKRDPTANGDNDEDSADDDNVGGRGEDPNDYEGEESTAASRVGNKRAAPSGNNDDSDSDGDSDGESDGEDEGGDIPRSASGKSMTAGAKRRRQDQRRREKQGRRAAKKASAGKSKSKSKLISFFFSSGGAVFHVNWCIRQAALLSFYHIL